MIQSAHPLTCNLETMLDSWIWWASSHWLDKNRWFSAFRLPLSYKEWSFLRWEVLPGTFEGCLQVEGGVGFSLWKGNPCASKPINPSGGKKAEILPQISKYLDEDVSWCLSRTKHYVAMRQAGSNWATAALKETATPDIFLNKACSQVNSSPISHTDNFQKTRHIHDATLYRIKPLWTHHYLDPYCLLRLTATVISVRSFTSPSAWESLIKDAEWGLKPGTFYSACSTTKLWFFSNTDRHVKLIYIESDYWSI